MNRSPYRYLQGKKLKTNKQSVSKSSPIRYKKVNTATHQVRETR